MGVITSSLTCCCPKQNNTTNNAIRLNIDDIDRNNELQDDRQNVKTNNINNLGIRPSVSVIKRIINPEDHYQLDQELGEGAYGRVVKVIHKQTGQIRAMKIVDKQLLDEAVDSKEIENEISVLKSLDHPNIIKVYEYFDYKTHLFIVNELIPNGDLFKLIETKKSISELYSLRIIYQVLAAVKYLHSENVIHGDIKPENIMIDNFGNCSFSNKQTYTSEELASFEVKLIDFGTSKFFSKNKVFNKLIGTSFYVAPEVILGGYHRQCDLWSCGVVLYTMLSGGFPFYSQDEDELYEKIKNDQPDFKNFPKVDPNTLDLISKLLEKNPLDRINANKSLEHPAFEKLNQIIAKKNEKIVGQDYSKNVLGRLKKSKSNVKFHQAITTFITHNFLSKEIASKHKNLFKALDKDGDGRLTTSELIEGYAKAGYNYKKEEIEQIIHSIDKDNNGYIELEEFISASVDINVLLSETNIKLAFETIDIDSSGKISFDEIASFLSGDDSTLIEDEVMCKIIEEVGKEKTDEFSLEDFTKIMTVLKNSSDI